MFSVHVVPPYSNLCISSIWTHHIIAMWCFGAFIAPSSVYEKIVILGDLKGHIICVSGTCTERFARQSQSRCIVNIFKSSLIEYCRSSCANLYIRMCDIVEADKMGNNSESCLVEDFWYLHLGLCYEVSCTCRIYSRYLIFVHGKL